jgi:hypothetical protein
VAGPAWSASAHVASAGVGAAATSIRDKIGRHCQPSSDWKWVGERERERERDTKADAWANRGVGQVR